MQSVPCPVLRPYVRAADTGMPVVLFPGSGHEHYARRSWSSDFGPSNNQVTGLARSSTHTIILEIYRGMPLCTLSQRLGLVGHVLLASGS